MAAAGDAKSALNQCAQKYCKRPINKQDLVYSSQRFGTGPTAQWQGTVTLGFLEGAQYAGEVAASEKEAGHNAARQALLTLEPLVAEMPSAPGKKNNNKRKASAAGIGAAMPAMMEQFAEFMGMTGEEVQAGMAESGLSASPAQLAGPARMDPASVTPKVELNTLCMKLCRRPLQKGETLYTTSPVAGGHQGTVALPCLPGEWGEKTWAGEVAATKPLAEHNAAAQALADLREDPELASKAAVPAASKNKGKGKGKDKGKDSWGKDSWGKGFDSWGKGFDSWGVIPGGWNKGFGKGKWGQDGGFKSKGKDRGPREPVTQIALTGEVVSWNGQFGFLQAHAPIDHPNAEMRGGKIYCCQKDLAAGIETSQIEQGQVVQFQVYSDSQGLGSTEVMPF